MVAEHRSPPQRRKTQLENMTEEEIVKEVERSDNTLAKSLLRYFKELEDEHEKVLLNPPDNVGYDSGYRDGYDCAKEDALESIRDM